MKDLRLRFTLLSDATFGRGDGVAGLVDDEVQHDDLGLPYLGGRTLKGLLGAECAEILSALDLACPAQRDRWRSAEDHLFGVSGASLRDPSVLQVGPARLPEDLRAALAKDVDEKRWTRSDVLGMLTALRRQTAMDAETGAPKKNTLRSMRVVLRGTEFEARLRFVAKPSDDDLALLAACVKAFRRAGTGRNRGRGRLQARLYEEGEVDVTPRHFEAFRKAVSQ